MFEIIFAVIVVTVLVMSLIYMFLFFDLDDGTKICMGITSFFTAVIISLIHFLLNSPLIK